MSKLGRTTIITDEVLRVDCSLYLQKTHLRAKENATRNWFVADNRQPPISLSFYIIWIVALFIIVPIKNMIITIRMGFSAIFLIGTEWF